MHVPRLPLNKCDKNNKFMQNNSTGINKLLVINFINFFFAFFCSDRALVLMLKCVKNIFNKKIFTAVIKFMHIAIIVLKYFWYFLNDGKAPKA